VHGHSGKIGRNGRKVAAHIPLCNAALAVILGCQHTQPARHHGVGRAGRLLVGAHLVGQAHQLVAVKHGRHHLAQQRHREGKTAVLFKAGKVQAGHRHIAKARLYQSLAQQVDIVGSAASAARLCNQQGGVLQIVFAAFQRANKLPNHQKRRVAGVVVHIFQALLRNFRASGGKHLGVIALILKGISQQRPVDGQHVGDENLVGVLHLFGEFGVNRKLLFHKGVPPWVLCLTAPARRTGCAGGYSQCLSS